jgi:hypothetical protein|nr:MAG TPA: hypothetical protein [Caudoviricetes sp.]
MIDSVWYEENILGYSTEKSYITQYTIDYLYDNNYNEGDIINILSKIKKESIKYKDLPSKLWNGLIERDTYYFHPELQILSKPPMLSISSDIIIKPVKFFKEIKISYTKQDVLNYFYRKANSKIIKDMNRDLGSLDYLLSRYKHQLMNSLDVILYLIDDHAFEANSLLALSNYEVNTLERIENMYYDNNRSGTDKIIYRWE